MEVIVQIDPPIVNPLSAEEMAKHDHGDDLDELLQVNGFTLQVTGAYTAPTFEPAYIPVCPQKKHPDIYVNTKVVISDIKLTLQRTRWRALLDAVLWTGGPRYTLTLTNEELRDMLFKSTLPLSTASQLKPADCAALIKMADEQADAHMNELFRRCKEAEEEYKAAEAERRRRENEIDDIDDIYDEEGCDD